MAALPPKGFASRLLTLQTPPASQAWLRIYGRTYADPLGYGIGRSRALLGVIGRSAYDVPGRAYGR